MELEIKEVKLEIYTPEEFVGAIRDGLARLGAGRVGEYSHVASWQSTAGSWMPLENSRPYSGEKGQLCTGREVKLEMCCPVGLVKEALGVIRAIHPYEEPVVHVIPLLSGS